MFSRRFCNVLILFFWPLCFHDSVVINSMIRSSLGESAQLHLLMTHIQTFDPNNHILEGSWERLIDRKVARGHSNLEGSDFLSISTDKPLWMTCYPDE